MTEEMRMALIDEYVSGTPLPELAARYGVHPTYPRKLAMRHNMPLVDHMPSAPARVKRPNGRPPLDNGNGIGVHVYLTAKQERWVSQKGHDAGKNRSWVIRNLIEKAMANDA